MTAGHTERRMFADLEATIFSMLLEKMWREEEMCSELTTAGFLKKIGNL